MSAPTTTRYLSEPAEAATLLERLRRGPALPVLSYATVRCYCESADVLPQITGRDGDLKNVQRPWAVKAAAASAPPPCRVLEIGGGEPVVSGMLSELGYDVTLVDPYDGFGNGPTEFEIYSAKFPHVRLVRDYFRSGMAGFQPNSFDLILSVSVLEHIPAEALDSCFAAIREFLRPGGTSFHCFDFIVDGAGSDYARANAQQILALQHSLNGSSRDPADELHQLTDRLRNDIETFFLSPQGHHSWRGGQPYDQFPFRKVVSVQTVARKNVPNGA